ncbi:MAG: hypothetical protein R2882_04770 [Gemmatimonadales bacterium]
MAITINTRPGEPASDLRHVDFRITNHGTGPAFLPACAGRPFYVVERPDPPDWIAAQGSFNLCIAILPMGAIRLEAGQSLAETTVVPVGPAYRLRLGFAASEGGSPDDTVVSGTFAVR